MSSFPTTTIFIVGCATLGLLFVGLGVRLYPPSQSDPLSYHLPDDAATQRADRRWAWSLALAGLVFLATALWLAVRLWSHHYP